MLDIRRLDGRFTPQTVAAIKALCIALEPSQRDRGNAGFLHGVAPEFVSKVTV